MDIYKLMKARYGSTSYPTSTIKPSLDNESIAQWLFEVAFFRDFVYRNPDKKPGKEFCDALVICGDTIIIVQIKTKNSKKSDIDWAKKNINAALSQLNGSYRAIKDKLVTKFRNNLLDVDVVIDEKIFSSIYGMIVLAQDCKPYDPIPLIDSKEMPKIPFVICSVTDLRIMTEQMDTAIDFITHFESRVETMKMGLTLLVNDELENLRKVGQSLSAIYHRHLSAKKEEIVDKTVRLVKDQTENGLRSNSDYKFSLLIDDMIARAHDIDPKFSEPGSGKDGKIPQIYGYLDRRRRIELGKKLYSAAVAARKSAAEIIVHYQRSIERVFIYVFSKVDREMRRGYLEALVAAAQIKYSVRKVIAVATEPVGMGGRSYDFYNTEDIITPSGTKLPDEGVPGLPELGDERLI